MTGSGLSQAAPVSSCQAVTRCPWPGELAKGPSLPPPPLVSQCEAHDPPIGVGREKNKGIQE